MKTLSEDKSQSITKPHSSLTLITGGARSGKSSFAQRLVESMSGPRIFIATCPMIDDETAQRISRHKQERAGRGWTTIEEERNLARAVSNADPSAVLLVDCLTLWINNLLYESERLNRLIGESEMVEHCDEVLRSCRNREGAVVLVTNEVGLGIVPANSQARLYRDLVGRSNQHIAAHADEVFLLTAGIPLALKASGLS